MKKIFTGGLLVALALVGCGSPPSTAPVSPSPQVPAFPTPPPTPVLQEGEPWATSDGVTYAVTWSRHPADPDHFDGYYYANGSTHPNSPYLEVDVLTTNRGNHEVDDPRPNVSANGTYLDTNPYVLRKPQTAPLLPGETGTFRSTWQDVPASTQVKVIIAVFDHSPGVNQQVTAYWTGIAP